MGLDGLSVSNLGLFKSVSPAEVMQEAAKLAQAQADQSIKKINESDSAALNPDKENKDEATNYEGRENKGENNEESNDNNNLQEEKFKKYKVHFNRITDMVELIDNSTGRIMETIAPNDLVLLISKSKNPSGILIDKEV
jgi:uncharacterized FlaG/YvyC family protein